MTHTDPTFPIDENLQDLLDQAQAHADNLPSWQGFNSSEERGGVGGGSFPLDDSSQKGDSPFSEGGQEDLLSKIKELESKLADAEQIAKKAQSDYIHMKFDFDSYMRRNDEQSKTAKVDTLVDVVRKFTPFIDSLRQSLANIPEDHANDVLVQGVQMVYNKFISSLEMMGIKTIQSIGLTPDHELHEAVSALPTDDEAMKGKIIQEFEQGFIYDKGDVRKVVNTAKVVVGQ